MVGNPSTDQAYRGEADADNVRTAEEEANAIHSSDPANISDETIQYDEDLMAEAAEAFESFGGYRIMADGGEVDPRVADAEEFTDYDDLAGVTMDRPGNSVDDYDQDDFEPHTEGPNYGEWANGFDDSEAMKAFSGLFE